MNLFLAFFVSAAILLDYSNAQTTVTTQSPIQIEEVCETMCFCDTILKDYPAFSEIKVIRNSTSITLELPMDVKVLNVAVYEIGETPYGTTTVGHKKDIEPTTVGHKKGIEPITTVGHTKGIEPKSARPLPSETKPSESGHPYFYAQIGSTQEAPTDKSFSDTTEDSPTRTPPSFIGSIVDSGSSTPVVSTQSPDTVENCMKLESHFTKNVIEISKMCHDYDYEIEVEYKVDITTKVPLDSTSVPSSLYTHTKTSIAESRPTTSGSSPSKKATSPVAVGYRTSTDKMTFILKTCTAVEPPGQVTNLADFNNEPYSVSLTWSLPSNIRNNSEPFLYYNVSWNDASTLLGNTDTTKSTYMDIKTRPYRQYKIEVTSFYYDKLEVIGQSADIVVHTPSAKPVKPEKLAGKVIDYTTIELSWEKGEYVGPQNFTIKIEESPKCDDLYLPVLEDRTVAFEEEPISRWTALKEKTCYKFKVNAVTSAGSSPGSELLIKTEEVSKINIGAIVGGVIGAIVVLALVAGLIFLAWKKKIWMFRDKDANNLSGTTNHGFKDDTIHMQSEIQRVEPNVYHEASSPKAPEMNQQQPGTRSGMTIEQIVEETKDTVVLSELFRLLLKSQPKIKPKIKSSDKDIAREAYTFPVKGFNNDGEFIVSTTPFRTEQSEIWSVILKNAINVIVMLTEEKEHGTVMCNRYWPEKYRNQSYGPTITVETVEEQEFKNYTKRTFKARQGNVERDIHHFQAKAWDNESCPKTDIIVELISAVRKHCNQTYVVFVHCCKDFYRTEYFLVIDYFMESIKNNTQNSLDVNAYISTIQETIPWRFAYGDKASQQYVSLYECLKYFWETQYRLYQELPTVIDEEYADTLEGYPGRNPLKQGLPAPPRHPPPSKAPQRKQPPPPVGNRRYVPPTPKQGDQETQEQVYVDLDDRGQRGE